MPNKNHPMINLYYSNDAQYLASLLTENLQKERASSPYAFFRSSRVVVQNDNVESFLKFEIAKTAGIFANVQFSFLEKFLSSLLPYEKVLVDRRLTHYLLVQYFMQNQATAGALPAEVETYLKTPGKSDKNNDIWVYQLANRLAQYFQDYAFSRPEMLQQWSVNKPGLPERFKASKNKNAKPKDQGLIYTEVWQQKIWYALFGPKGKVAELSKTTKRQYHGLHEVTQLLSAKILSLPERVHLFGFSYLYQNHNQMLAQLADRMEINIYTVNPCAEFWEDVLTPAEVSRLKQRSIEAEKRKRRRDAPVPENVDRDEDPYHLNNLYENEFLQRWGRSGRENIQILNNMVSTDFYSGFVPPIKRGYSLLRKIQQDILKREITQENVRPENYSLAQDNSLRILKCPEIRREVEVIANEIWSLVREDEIAHKANDPDRLRFNDIAVIIANTSEYDTYATHIASVFHDIHDIPHTIADLSPKTSSIIEAVELLLSLPVNPVDRPSLLGVLTHPALLAQFPAADAEEWIAWCGDLAILHGESSEDHKDSYIEKDLYNWDQGLRRLALGAFMEGGRSGEERPFVAGNKKEYLPQDFKQGSLANASTFIALVRSLLADRRFALSNELTLAEWAGFMQTFIKTYLKAETPEDERVLARCLGNIASLARLDVEKKQTMTYRMAREFAAGTLQSVTLSRGAYLAHGVVVSSFLPMRPVPFKAVFIAGMGEGCFPAREMRDPLDLRNAYRSAGDVQPRERDQYNFLETLISTRDLLRLSYVSRDSQTGEAKEQSSIIKELNFILEQRYKLTREELDSLVIEHPLRRYDEKYFPTLFKKPAPALPNYSPAALKEAQAVRLRQELDMLLRENKTAVDSKLLETYGKNGLKEAKGLLYPFAIPTAAEKTRKDTITLSLYAVRKFLECPLQGWASFQLGLKENEEEDILANADEAFATEKLAGILRQRKVFSASRRSAAGWSECEKELARVSASAEMKGQAPTGIFLDAEQAAYIGKMRVWESNWEYGNLPTGIEWRTTTFGRADEYQDIDIKRDAIMVPVVRPGAAGQVPLQVQLTGTVKNISADSTRGFYLSTSDKGITPKNFLEGFLDYAVLCASGGPVPPAFEATVLSMKETGKVGRAKTLVFAGFTQESAKAYLSGIVAELLFGVHAYLLPIEAVVKHRWKNKDGQSLSEIINDLKDSIGEEHSSFSSMRGPVSHPEDYNPLPEADAAGIVERRFGPWFTMMPGAW